MCNGEIMTILLTLLAVYGVKKPSSGRRTQVQSSSRATLRIMGLA